MQPPTQTVYIQQQAPAPLNYTTTTQQPGQNNQLSKEFNGRGGAVTGWIQLCCGLGGIVVAIAEAVLASSIGYSFYGIWAGILFYIPTGILGIVSAKRNTCVIIAYMVMAIFSALFGCAMLITGAIGAGVSNGCYYYYYVSCEADLVAGRVASDSILAIIGLIEMITAIVASAFCCGGICCGTQQPALQHSTVVTTHQAAPMVVTTAQYAQQPMIQPTFAQPQPPPYNVHHAYPPNVYPPNTAPM